MGEVHLLLLCLLLHPAFLLCKGTRMRLLLLYQLLALRTYPRRLFVSMALDGLLLTKPLRQLSLSLLRYSASQQSIPHWADARRMRSGK